MIKRMLGGFWEPPVAAGLVGVTAAVFAGGAAVGGVEAGALTGAAGLEAVDVGGVFCSVLA